MRKARNLQVISWPATFWSWSCKHAARVKQTVSTQRPRDTSHFSLHDFGRPLSGPGFWGPQPFAERVADGGHWHGGCRRSGIIGIIGIESSFWLPFIVVALLHVAFIVVHIVFMLLLLLPNRCGLMWHSTNAADAKSQVSFVIPQVDCKI